MNPATSKYEAVVIGGSAGSLEALLEILPALPANFPLPIFVVIHLPPDRKSVIPELLGGSCLLEVREARDKETIQRGTIYFAPPDYHLLVESDGHLSLSYDEPQLYSRPSIDVLFESAADVFGPDLIGVVLSGANSDGSRGLREIEAAGGAVLVQSPAQAQSREMPEAALKACASARSLDAGEIVTFLKEVCQHAEN